jgi:hypothetical protein
MRGKWIVSMVVGASAAALAFLASSLLTAKKAEAGIFPLAQGCNHDGKCANYLGVKNGMVVQFIESKSSCPDDCH